MTRQKAGYSRAASALTLSATGAYVGANFGCRHGIFPLLKRLLGTLWFAS
jgi:hypothetical protein